MSTSGFRRFATPLHALLVAAAVAAAAYVALPNTLAAESLRIAAPLVVAGLSVRAWRSGGEASRSAPWLAIVGYGLLTAAAHTVCALLTYRGDPDAPGHSFPSVVDALHVGAAAVLAFGVVAAARAIRPPDDVLGSFEAATIAIAAAVGVWLVVAEPALAEGERSTVEIAIALAAPLISTVTVATAIRLLGDHRRSAPALWLAVGAIAQLCSDAVRGSQFLDGAFVLGGVAASLGIVAPLLIVGCALVPHAGDEGTDHRPAMSVGRTVGLSVVVLAPLMVLVGLIVADVGTATTRLVISLAAVGAVGFALVRLWGLLDAVRRLTERRGQDRLAAMVEHSSDVVLLMNEHGAINYASPGLAGTLGHRPADWLGRALIDLVADESREEARGQMASVVSSGPDATVKFETTLVRVDGQRRRMEATIANLLGGDAVDGVVATFRDVTEQRNLERQLSHRAFHDELTGLANRALFLDRMDHALRVARAESDPVVVLFVDLDDFKSVNDALGHGVGDQLLRTIADRVRAAVGPGDTPSRLGGDEFAVLLEDQGGVDRAIDVAQALLDELAQPAKLSGYDLSVRASVGVAVAAPGMTTSGLLRDADIAMYEAKRAGKGQIKIFDPAMRLGATTQLEFRTELVTALDESQFRLVYQPLVSLRTGEVVGAEALVRWSTPERGEISPTDFIPVAERGGLIIPIGEWVLRSAMAEAVRWQARGRRRVNINVSAAQMRSGGLADQVAAALAATGLDPTVVTLEITETALVEQVDEAVEVVEAVRDLGVSIAIDDFGTGYCSLSYLQRFPVDVLKIDRQFVDEVDGDRRQASLARMILQMSSALDVESVAEGIERPSQIEALRRLGCDLGQGYLLSRPLEVDVVRRRFGVDEPLDADSLAVAAP